MRGDETIIDFGNDGAVPSKAAHENGCARTSSPQFTTGRNQLVSLAVSSTRLSCRWIGCFSASSSAFPIAGQHEGKAWLESDFD